MHTDRILFSVILAAYNVEETIEFTLKSLECQTYRNFEVILINDDSKDSTHRIISNFLLNTDIELVTYVINPINIGLSEVRNKGINIAKGEYLLFLDGDDAYHNQSLYLLSNLLKKFKISPEILFFSAATFLIERKDVTDPYMLNLYEDRKGYERVDLGTKLVSGLNWFKEVVGNNTYHDASCLMAIKVDYLRTKKIKFVKNLIFEDMLFTRNVLLMTDKVGVSNELILLVRKANRSITRSPLNLKKIKSKFYISKKILNIFKNTNDDFFYYDSLNIYLSTLRQIKKSKFLFFINSPIDMNIYFFRRENIVRTLIISLFKCDIKKILGHTNKC